MTGTGGGRRLLSVLLALLVVLAGCSGTVNPPASGCEGAAVASTELNQPGGSIVGGPSTINITVEAPSDIAYNVVGRVETPDGSRHINRSVDRSAERVTLTFGPYSEVVGFEFHVDHCES